MTTNGPTNSSFFSQANAAAGANVAGVLINTQVDPTLPENSALDRVSDPLLPDENFQQIIRNFDPDLYDLRSTSHIVRLIKALTGGAGTGGTKKQIITSRINGSLAVTAFADLDKFYGAIFNFNRYQVESLPVTAIGAKLNPSTDTATPDVWDDAKSRDARYRSRVFQVARAINMGGSISGIKGVCEALLSCEVDVSEAWQRNDQSNLNFFVTTTPALNYGNIKAQYVTYIGFHKSYYFAQAQAFGTGVAPTTTRGEVVITPRRLITNEEQLQLMKVLRTIAPSHVQITISSALNQAASIVPVRGYYSDSEDWDVIPRITPSPNLNQPTVPLYDNSNDTSIARPVNSEYSGEAWTYNANVINTNSYQIVDTQTIPVPSTETIYYPDKTSHKYSPKDALMDIRQALAERLSGDGVVTSFPFKSLR